MSTNPETCSNCGAENPPGEDFCVDCGKPLTQSAEAGLREQNDAQEDGGVFGTGFDDADGKPNVDGGASQRRTGT